MTGPGTAARWGIEAITGREYEYWALLAAGKANEAIAEELNVTLRAVEKALSSIFWKLDLNGDATQVNRRVMAARVFWGLGPE